MNLENKVIKVLNEEHGKKVIQWFKDQGIDTDGLSGCLVGNYYGFNESIESLDYWVKIPTGYTVIELPNELPKSGDKILVWDSNDEKPKERIFFTYLEGTSAPILTVCQNDEERFLKNEVVDVIFWKHYKLIEPKIEVEVTMDEIADKFGVDVSQLKIKK